MSPSARRKGDWEVPFRILSTATLRNLSEFFALSAAADLELEFTVAWVDCAASGKHLGRGILLSGDFAPASAGSGKRPKAHGLLNVPFTPPVSLINSFSLKVFNALYYRKPEGKFLTHYEPFFYPLDAIGHWNRIYGPRGFLQYQCVLPPEVAEPALSELLARIAKSGQGSVSGGAEAVWGDKPAVGMLSFPGPGVTIALDFPMLGASTLWLLNELDEVVVEVGGMLYMAKDARKKLFANQLNGLHAYSDHSLFSGIKKRVVKRHESRPNFKKKHHLVQK